MHSSYICYFDGACKGNPGIGAYGFCIYKNRTLLLESGGFSGKYVTSNICEYIAFIELLKFLNSLEDEYVKKIVILGDSILVVKQVQKPRVKSKVLKRYHRMSRKLLDELRLKYPSTKISVDWISRKQNKRADRIAKTYRICFEQELRGNNYGVAIVG